MASSKHLPFLSKGDHEWPGLGSSLLWGVRFPPRGVRGDQVDRTSFQPTPVQLQLCFTDHDSWINLESQSKQCWFSFPCSTSGFLKQNLIPLRFTKLGEVPLDLCETACAWECKVLLELTCKTSNLLFPGEDFVNRVTSTMVSVQCQVYKKISSELWDLYGSGVRSYSSWFPFCASDFPGILRPLSCLWIQWLHSPLPMT